jgi:NADH-quinone oxidoreductase subunit C
MSNSASTPVTSSKSSEELLELLTAKFQQRLLESKVDLGDVVVRIRRENLLEFFSALKSDPELQFNFFVNVTAVDWMDARDERFEVVYHLMSVPLRHRLRVKVDVPEVSPEVDSVVSLWPGADFMEREVWDMFGISFKGHPNQRRILMYDEFVGHPLRKDYPIQAKQPRIPMLHPEVRNTAVDMVRPPLVRINPRKDDSSASHGSGAA